MLAYLPSSPTSWDCARTIVHLRTQPYLTHLSPNPLRRLALSTNRIEKMISLEGMTSLEILSVGRNRIKNLQVSRKGRGQV